MKEQQVTKPITAPCLGKEESDLVAAVFASGWVTQGPMTRKFEELFASRHDVKFALGTTSCTAALHLAAEALELGPGDEVIVPAFTWVTSAHSAEYVGAKAVFADVKLETFNVDPAAFEAAITPRTRALVAVHLFGLAADMEALKAIAQRHGIRIIEDAACAVGTTYRGKPVGGLGDVGCFSFHPRKVITTGEGGMVTTGLPELAAKVRSLRNHGAGVPNPEDPDLGKPYFMGPFEMLGYNLRLSDIQAAVGVAQMARLDGLLAHRRMAAMQYHGLLGGMEELALPLEPAGYGHTYQSYVIRFKSGDRLRRNRVMEHLASRGIQTRPGTHAVHRLGYYKQKYGLRADQFPNACLGEDSTITLPIFPGMTMQDQEFVAEALAEGLK